MIKIFYFVLIGLFIHQTNLFSEWSYIGPDGGDCAKIFSVINKPFLSLKDGSLYSSDDNCQTWNLLNIPFAADYSCYFTKIVADGNNFWGITNIAANQYFSSNAGQNWITRNSGSINFIANDIAFFDQKVYAATNKGLYYSTNQGLSWINEIYFGINPVYSLHTTQTQLFAGVRGAVNTYTKSTGKWTTSNSLGANNISKVVMSGKLLYAISGNTGILTSSDNGKVWNLLNNLPTTVVSDFTTFGANLYFSNSYEIFYSSNAGIDWNSASKSLNNEIIYGLYSTDYMAYAITNSGIYICENGQEWTNSSFGVRNNDINSICQHNGKLNFTTRGGLLFRDYQELYKWNNVRKQAFAGVINGMAADSLYSFISTNLGLFRISTLDEYIQMLKNNSFTVICKSAANVCAATSSRVFYSSNNGYTWDSSYKVNLIPSTCYDILYSYNKIFIADSKGLYWKKDSVWIKCKDSLVSVGIRAISRYKNYLITGSSTGIVYASSDTGTTWKKIRNNDSTLINKIKICGNYIALATDKGPKMSSDLGQSWQNAFYKLNGYKIYDIFADSLMIYAGSQSGLFKSPLDKFANQVPQITGIHDLITDENVPVSIDFKVADDDLAGLTITTKSDDNILIKSSSCVISGAGTDRKLTLSPEFNQFGKTKITINAFDGLSTGSVTLNLTVIQTINVLENSDDKDFQLILNSEANSLLIKTSETDFSFSLYNQMGQELINNSNKNEIEIANFPNGIYFGMLKAGNRTFLKKFIIIK
ncbi:MAG: T9SS type A sorting domain-containing protein [Candidatus Kapabacteria bacterium]|nr:T9SS type A sorting domain-containing protein [Candidatus Kapabacteria bacterium]